jgi:D-beta-D-heptose 7-phosphate kinase/D-beta-D-heptose 1-phosphate adenosyltransferase
VNSSAVQNLPVGGSKKVLVVGDVIVDAYLRGGVSRISPEAPVPILASTETTHALGGAANVALNLQHLGCQTLLCGAVGDDAPGMVLQKLMQSCGLSTQGIFVAPGRPTTHKLRVVSQVQHLLRIDREVQGALPKALQAEIVAFVEQQVEGVDAIICSDYKKGLLTSGLLQALLAAATRTGKPVFVDPKGADYRLYRGATVLTPNLMELAAATQMEVLTQAGRTRAAVLAMQQANAAALLLTCGKEGMQLFEQSAQGRGEAPVRIASQAREVFDVTGAGDTVIAALCMAHLGNMPLGEAAQVANVAAGLVVGKLGTATVSRAELIGALERLGGTSNSKVMALGEVQAQARRWQAAGRKVVFTNGCYDLLHAGHVHGLQAARSLGDALVVAVNTDQGVRRLKGAKRPLVPQQERGFLLAALACVDAVVFFDAPTPLEIIEAVQPNILVKGADYANKAVVGREVVEAQGGRVELLPLAFGRSTTGLVDTIVERFAGKKSRTGKGLAPPAQA